MIPEFDQNGNLPVGFIRPTIGEFKERFVVELGGSGTILDRYVSAPRSERGVWLSSETLD